LIQQWATREDPNDECVQTQTKFSDYFVHPVRTVANGVSQVIRVLPFMQTDPEETLTIGNLDPPRSPRGTFRSYGATTKPFGTTHELRRSDKEWQYGKRKMDPKVPGKELPLAYNEIATDNASCPVASHWLSRVRSEKKKRENAPYATGWDSNDLRLIPGKPEDGVPALRFIHGFDLSGISPPTRANDPFWNLRAFDTALAAHDGYMLSSFICAVNQLVLDDSTEIIK
jgi:hypothetical protein